MRPRRSGERAVKRDRVRAEQLNLGALDERKLETLKHTAIVDEVRRHRLDEDEIEPARALAIGDDEVIEDLGEHLARERIEEIVDRLAVGGPPPARHVEQPFANSGL